MKPRAMIDKVPVWCAHDKIVDCSELIPNPKNPNTHPASQIELLGKIILKQGWRLPITVSKRSGLIVKGHGRLEAVLRVGISKAPVDYQDYESESAEHADLVADNRLAELATMDQRALENILKEIDQDLLEFTGFDDDEIANIFAGSEIDIEKPEVEFSKELLLEHNYIVLYFDNAFDWQVAENFFQLKRVKDLTPRKAQPVGIGRVLDGAKWIKRQDD